MKLVFLDRDGTLNVDHGYVHSWEQWQFVDGALDGLRMLLAADYQLAVVSNQSGVARGMFDRGAVDALHQRVTRALAEAHIPLIAMAYCPHGPDDDCPCRKPRTGLAQQIESQLNSAIDYAQSWTIGDKLSDIEFGRHLGTRTALLVSRYWNADQLAFQPDVIADDLKAAARHIIQL